MDKNVALLVHLLTLSFGFPLVILAQDEIQCPNPPEIEPCVCEINYDFGYDTLLLDCSAESTEELQAAFQVDFPIPVVNELFIRNATLESLPADVFGGKELKENHHLRVETAITGWKCLRKIGRISDLA